MCHSPTTSNDYTCALQCPGSGLRPLRSHHHLPLQILSPSLDVASHGYLQHVYWSTTSTPYPGPKTMHLHKLHRTSKFMSDTGNWKPGCQNNPRSSQSGPGQSEWPVAEKGATRCGSIWIRWTFMPRFHVSICKGHSPHSADFFAEKNLVSHGTLNSECLNTSNSRAILGASLWSILYKKNILLYTTTATGSEPAEFRPLCRQGSWLPGGATSSESALGAFEVSALNPACQIYLG